MVCAHCNNEFESLKENKRYCSNRCKWQVKAKRKQNPYYLPVVKTVKPEASLIYSGYCNYCRAPFVSRRKTKYCSRYCGRKFHLTPEKREKDKVRLFNTKGRGLVKNCTCATCGIHFKTNYRSKEWKTIRLSFIESYSFVNGTQLSNRYCIECYKRKGILKPMHAVDHIVRRRDNGPDTHNNLQSLCKHHHQSKSASEGNAVRINFGGRPKKNISNRQSITI